MFRHEAEHQTGPQSSTSTWAWAGIAWTTCAWGFGDSSISVSVVVIAGFASAEPEKTRPKPNTVRKRCMRRSPSRVGPVAGVSDSRMAKSWLSCFPPRRPRRSAFRPSRSGLCTGKRGRRRQPRSPRAHLEINKLGAPFPPRGEGFCARPSDRLLRLALAAPPAAFHAPFLGTQGHQQRAEVSLLRLVESLEQRLGRVGDQFEFAGGFGEAVGYFVQPIDWRGTPVVAHSLTLLAHRIASRLGRVANRQFERRPQFFLVGRQLEGRLHAGEPRVEHEAAVVRPLHAGGVGRVAGRGERVVGEGRTGQRDGGEVSQNALSHRETSQGRKRRQKILHQAHYIRVTSL